MRKTLYIHIGHFKTGTTALQTFLSCNPKFLAKHDLNYAEVCQKFSKHSRLAFSIYRAAGIETLMHNYNNPAAPEELWGELFDYVRGCKQSRVIVSSEEFMRMGAHPKAAAMLPQMAALAPDIDIRIIAYLRAPDAHLRSWYNQLVKMKVKVPDFNRALSGVIEPVHYDYALALAPWVEIFGAEAVTVRPYTAEIREGTNLFADFIKIFGVDLPARGVYVPRKDPNPRLDDRTLEMTRLMQNAGLPANITNWTAQRAGKLLDAEAGAGEDGAAFEAVCAQIRAGLKGVADLPGNAVDTDSFAARLPEPEDQGIIESHQMIGFLLSEIHLLRQRLNSTLPALTARLDALEAAQGNKGD